MRAMLKGHEYAVRNVAFFPNGCSLLSASADQWNIRDASSKNLPVIIWLIRLFYVCFTKARWTVRRGWKCGQLALGIGFADE